MPTLDFSNAQNLMNLGLALENDTENCTEQPVTTPEQIAEAQHQEMIGVVLFIVMTIALAAMVYFGDKRG